MTKTEIQIVLPSEKTITIDLKDEDLSWEIEETDEREMGVERLHETILEKDIEGEDEPLVITLRVWEYPEGFLNMQEIDVEGGELVEECDLGQFVISYYEDDEDESES